MGSYCELKFDELSVHSSKSHVPDSFISLFQETDRQLSFDDDGDPTVKYVASRETVLKRLDILGLTSAAARDAYLKWWAAEKDLYSDLVHDGQDWALVDDRDLDRLSFAEWGSRVPRVLRTRYDMERIEAADPIDRRMCDLSDGWLFFDAADERLVIRAMLDVCPDVAQVVLDVSALVMGGYIDAERDICTAAREPGAIERPVLEPAIVLGEGSSDIKILQRSLGALYPELTDYFSFFDHDGISVDGGASYLVKFIRAFAAARMSSRIVAVFDNDAAGIEAYNDLVRLKLPTNIKVLKLPDIDLAKSYPTLGPQGAHEVDVNGRAASIEMYLGRQNLVGCDGKLRPVRWHGYLQKARAYQGEIDGKAEVVKAFDKELTKMASPERARALHPELVTVWESIFELLMKSST